MVNLEGAFVVKDFSDCSSLARFFLDLALYPSSILMIFYITLLIFQILETKKEKSIIAMPQWNIDNILKHMQKLEKVVHIQLVQLQPFFQNHERVNAMYKQILRHSHGFKLTKEHKDEIFRYCMLKKLSVMRVTGQDEYLPSLVCYDKNGMPLVELRNTIVKGSHVRLVNGRLLDPALQIVPQMRTLPECVVKIYYSKKHNQIRTCDFEVQVYEELGCPSPYIPIEAYIWTGARVLVMKKMTPLSHEFDDGHEVGRQVLPQLQKVFELPRTHSDIKPQNIMAEANPADGGKTHIYKLIDFLGCSKKWGSNPGMLERRTYSPHWTSQDKTHDIDTSAKNDLIELGYTMNSLVGKSRLGDKKEFDVKENMLSGRLTKYMNYVKKLPDNHFAITPKVITDLQNILSKKSEEKNKKKHSRDEQQQTNHKRVQKLSSTVFKGGKN
jgi:hypothetical protein